MPEFLHFGYIPHVRVDWAVQPWSQIDVRKDLHSMSWDDLKRRAIDSFRVAFDRERPGPQVVLLSAGLDSRAILGMLLDRYPSSEIVAATFGTPGTYDFDIPQQVCRSYGVEHVLLDLTKMTYDLRSLRSVADELQDTPMWLFGAMSNRKLADTVGPGTYWSGYLGGPVTGSHAPKSRSATWEEAIGRHVRRRPFAQMFDMGERAGGVEARLIRASEPFDSPLTLDERVDLLVRQHTFLEPEHMMKRRRCVAPLTEPGFLEVMFNLPAEMRSHQRAYIDILHSAFPSLFAMSLKGRLGLPASAGTLRTAVRRTRSRLRSPKIARSAWVRQRYPRQMINHIDWDEAFRSRNDLVDLADEAIDRLQRRDVLGEVDARRLLADHRHRRIDGGLAVSLLISLEVLLDVELSQEK